ncbi:hypothetical protein QUF76_07295 [Desulfobacterales bacterium HSG16]|nr:hypothetical protein [Desulfobacterales bacterium HSG16]
MEIDTPFDPDSKKPGLVARTLVQPDADVIMYVSKDALDRPDLLEKHFDILEKKILTIRRFRLFLKSVPLILLVVGIALLMQGSFDIDQGQINKFMWGVFFSGISCVIKPLAKLVFAAYVRMKT